jgi:hypothetical protein
VTHRRLQRASMFFAALTVCAPAWSTVLAQPEPREEREPSAVRPRDPEAAKDLLRRRMEEIRGRLDMLEGALDRIEKGEPVADVMRDAEPALRGPGRGEGPRRGPDGGPDGRPDGGPDDLGPPDRPRSRNVTPEDRDRAMTFIREHMPELARRLDRLREISPEAADRAVMRLGPRLREAQAMRAKDPERFDLRVREIEGGFIVMDSAREYRQLKIAAEQDPTKQSEVEPARDKLREALANQFDLRLANQRMEVEAIKKRLKALEDDLATKEKDRESMIDSMLEKIGESEDPRDMDPPPGRPRRSE